MLIVSQNKEIITNFDNTLGIQIEKHIKNSDGEIDYGIKVITERKACNIGIYKTEERAKEVLQEIVLAYVNMKKAEDGSSLFGGCLFIPKDTLYEMPEE